MSYFWIERQRLRGSRLFQDMTDGVESRSEPHNIRAILGSAIVHVWHCYFLALKLKTTVRWAHKSGTIVAIEAVDTVLMGSGLFGDVVAA
jgi:hypothetical protein